MFLAVGAASTALDAIQSLTSPGSSAPPSSQPAGGLGSFDITDNAPTPAPPPRGSNGWSQPQVSPSTMSALLAAQGQSSTGSTTSASISPLAALQNLFSQIDTNGDGLISKSEFENALDAGGTNITQADKVFNELDTNGDGLVSLGELSSALKGAGPRGGHHHAHAANSSDSPNGAGAAGAAAGTGGASSNPLLQALAGASSTTANNSNGSTTTSLTYADGSLVTMTTPATNPSSSSATSSYNIIEQMIQRQASLISSSAALFSLNV